MSGVNARSDVQHWYGMAELSEKVSCEAMKLNGFFLVLCCSNSSSNGTVMTVSPAQSSYLEYHIPANVLSVVVRAQSDDDLCGVMSLQELKVGTTSSL